MLARVSSSAPKRHFRERDREIRAFDAVFAVFELHVVRPGFQRPRRELRSFSDDLLRCCRERAAVRHHGARAHRAAADERRAGRVARFQLDVVWVKSKNLPDDFRQDGFMPLSRGAGEHMQRRVTRLAELDHCLFFRCRARPRGLAEHRAADAAQLSTRSGETPSIFKAVPIGFFESLIELARRVAAVVG